jgi:hypothetical protein
MRKRGHPPLNKNSAAATKLLQQANGPLEGMRGGEGRGGEPPLVAGDESTSTAQLMAKNYRLAKELVCELIDFHVNVWKESAESTSSYLSRLLSTERSTNPAP